MSIWNNILRGLQPGAAQNADIRSRESDVNIRAKQQEIDQTNYNTLISLAGKADPNSPQFREIVGQIIQNPSLPEPMRQRLTALHTAPTTPEVANTTGSIWDFGDTKSDAYAALEAQRLAVAGKYGAQTDQITQLTPAQVAAAEALANSRNSSADLNKIKGEDINALRPGKMAVLDSTAEKNTLVGGLFANRSADVAAKTQPEVDKINAETKAITQKGNLDETKGKATEKEYNIQDSNAINNNPPAVDYGLSSFIDSMPQDTKSPDANRWFPDNTISPENATKAIKQYKDALIASGYTEDQAQKKAMAEYADLLGGDSGNYKKYPSINLSGMFKPESVQSSSAKTSKMEDPLGIR